MKKFVFPDHKPFVRSICFPLYNSSISYNHVHANQSWRVFDIFVVLPVRSSTRFAARLRSLIICRCISQTFLDTESEIKMLVSILGIFFCIYLCWSLFECLVLKTFTRLKFPLFPCENFEHVNNDDFIISYTRIHDRLQKFASHKCNRTKVASYLFAWLVLLHIYYTSVVYVSL